MSRQPMQTKPWLTILAALACLGGCGCSGLQFQKQVAVCTFSPNAKEVRALLVYEHFQVAGDKEQDLKKAEQELTSLMTSRQEFYLALSLLKFSLAPREAGAEETESAKKLRALAQRHVTIASGPLYLNKDGKLCGAQTLTIRDAQKFTQGLNELISAGLDKSITEELTDKKKQDDDLDEETLRVIQKAAHGGYEWLQLEPGRISFSLPGTPKTLADVKRKALRALLVKDLEQLVDPPPRVVITAGPFSREAIRKKAHDFDLLVAFLAETPLSIDQRPDRLVFSLGEGQGQPLRLTTPDDPQNPGKPRKFDKELIAHARTLKVEFKENLTADVLIAEFLRKNGPMR